MSRSCWKTVRAGETSLLCDESLSLSPTTLFLSRAFWMVRMGATWVLLIRVCLSSNCTGGGTLMKRTGCRAMVFNSLRSSMS